MTPKGVLQPNVTVTWMPHTALSQTSYVCLSIRSAHATLDPLSHSKPEEWQMRVRVCAIGGVDLVPSVPSLTPTSDVKKREPGDVRRPSVTRATHDCFWDAFLQLPLRWRDLPRDSYFLFEILGRDDAVLYAASLSLFDKFGKLRTKLHRVKLEDPDLFHSDLSNRGISSLFDDRTSADKDDSDPVWNSSCILDELERFDQSRAAARLEKRFGTIPSVPWLDDLTKERCTDELTNIGALYDETLCWNEDMPAFIIVELPDFDIPIVYEETFYPIPEQGASGGITPLDLAEYKRQTSEGERSGGAAEFDSLQLVKFLDFENENDNPVEDKYRALAHDLLRGMVDPALKPDRNQRERLEAIINSPSYHPTREEKDLLWRFRFSLVDNRRALTKFLLAVDWTVDSEVVQAAELLEQWRKRSPIEVSDALKLLGKHVAFQTNLVRSYAIDTLGAAPDSELRLYLLQLVQALRYEAADIDSQDVSSTSSLAAFLIDRAACNIELANYFYWYVKVELENQTHGSRYREVFSELRKKLSQTPFEASQLNQVDESTAHKLKSIVDSVSTKIGAFNDKEILPGGIQRGLTLWDILVAQDEFITGILDLQAKCRLSKGKKDAKEEQLRSLLAKQGFDRTPNRQAVPLPSAPYVFVDGVQPQTAKIFKSALYPAVLDFHAQATLKIDEKAKSLTRVIVKTGDDLRQDQLVIMMIQLMERLLKRSALDLCLTPYSILATSPNSGLVEFIDHAHPISQILANHNNSILQFFQDEAFQKDAKYGVRPDVMSHYVRSCAGYCVITYLLGVGDRHLDNILLRTTGHFFHIDFGFIFGRDPKPLPPAFRLTREMVDGMGGLESSEYRQFCSLACQAFNSLRKSAGLILNLLHLMTDAGIEDLSNNPAADSEGVIAKVEERFRLALTDEQAELYFKGLINDCLGALAPRVMDVFHNFSVARR